MDNADPPEDPQLQNIIDKLAEFVARNGPEFEQMTKTKQQGNPKFSFLFGGEYYNYYIHRREKEIDRFSFQYNGQGGPWHATEALSSMQQKQQPNPNQSEIDAIILRQTTLRDQIRQSELNLQAQHNVLLGQQQKVIEDAVKLAQIEAITQQAEKNQISLLDFDRVLQPIIDSCTKDSISNGKSWILQHTSDVAPKCHVVSQYLLKKAMTEGASFLQKLHLIYLVNDVIHHCVRKNSEDLKKCLENVVIPMFCHAQIHTGASEEQIAKLTKLLTLWESKANFFDACVISKLRNAQSSLQEYQASLLTQHAAIIAPLTQQSKATFENYQQQHQAFVEHASRQIATLETQKRQIEADGLKILQERERNQQQFQQNQSPQTNASTSQPTPKQLSNLLQVLKTQIGTAAAAVAINGSPRGIPSLMSQNIPAPTNSNSNSGDESRGGDDSDNRQRCKVSRFSDAEPQWEKSHSGGDSRDDLSPIAQKLNDYTLPPPGHSNMPDMSRPPPGFDAPEDVAIECNPEDLIPKLPYFELPAGVMVPLIRLEDYNYRSLDPNEIKLPPMAPPGDRLLQAVEAFYALPSHERPRDGEGWEKLGLYEYFKVKNSARKQKEEELLRGERQKSRSPTPVDSDLLKPPKRRNKRTYRSRSPSRSPRSRSPTPQREPTPPPVMNQRRQRSPSPPPIRNRRERKRSLTPPSFAGASFTKSTTEFIAETNKGHQMLMKMGWSGAGRGLGAAEQGIDAPINAGDVRERHDQYKGVGVPVGNQDPYESFRRNKANSFIHRIRARDNERS